MNCFYCRLIDWQLFFSELALLTGVDPSGRCSDDSLQQMGLLNSTLLAPEIGEPLWKTGLYWAFLRKIHLSQASLWRGTDQAFFFFFNLVIDIENKAVHKCQMKKMNIDKPPWSRLKKLIVHMLYSGFISTCCHFLRGHEHQEQMYLATNKNSLPI